MNAINNYFKGVWHEVRGVTWPKRDVVIWYTVGVIAISFFCGYFMGVFDVVFQKLLQLFIGAF